MCVQQLRRAVKWYDLLQRPNLTFVTSFLFFGSGIYAMWKECTVMAILWSFQSVTSIFFHGWLLLYDRNNVVWHQPKENVTITFKFIRCVDMCTVHTLISFGVIVSMYATWPPSTWGWEPIMIIILFACEFTLYYCLPRLLCFQKGEGFIQHSVIHIIGAIGMICVCDACVNSGTGCIGLC